MSNTLLARFAQNVFWLGRYIERVDNLARILDINETYARESHGSPDWRRVLEIYGDTERFDASRVQTGEHDVLNFYVLDTKNFGSLVSSVNMARENARSIRHLISTEMWTQLNTFHTRVLQLTQRDIWPTHISRLCKEMKEACQTFEGVAEGTFFRGPAWHFYSMGKYIERADQTTRVLYLGCDLLEEDRDAVNTVRWNALLRSVAAYHAFRWVRPRGHRRGDIINFLLHDEGFPRSVKLCVGSVEIHIENLVLRRGQPRVPAVENACTHLNFVLETGLGHEISAPALRSFLDQLEIGLIRVSDEIAAAYFRMG
ncbi:MAG: alpha-E domain-containing protein [Nitrospirota bacterium]|nr:alpha-E domain-containing protein [Nitrospirota bacterium]